MGMVTRGADGRMAAATTTSGMAYKLPGRVGDSPIVGAGLYVDDEAGGAVATGLGEEVIKVCGCYQIVEFMRQGLEPGESIRLLIERMLKRNPELSEVLLAFAAMRADGAVGFGSTVDGFEGVVSRGEDSHELIAVDRFSHP
jgi:isoaspartyl peptidase/L-asparaginase-like protein (Ntn-hydrolase superfamily)